jgi:hypothetical protein
MLGAVGCYSPATDVLLATAIMILCILSGIVLDALVGQSYDDIQCTSWCLLCRQPLRKMCSLRWVVGHSPSHQVYIVRARIDDKCACRLEASHLGTVHYLHWMELCGV